MESRDPDERLWLAAGKKVKEREYWLEKLAGELPRSIFPTTHECERERTEGESSEVDYRKVRVALDRELSSGLMKLSTGSDVRLHIVLTALLVLLLGKYTGNDDIIIGSPILRSVSGEDAEKDTHKNKGIELINTVLTLRNFLDYRMSFKKLLIQVRQTFVEADEHRNYPLKVLLKQLNLSTIPFDAVILLENIHDIRYIRHISPNMIFSFLRKDRDVEGVIEYNAISYERITIEQITHHFERLAREAVLNFEIPVSKIAMLSENEKRQLLVNFNDTTTEYPAEKTIDELFEEQVSRGPDKIALTYENEFLTYKELHEKAGALASYLHCIGIKHEEPVALMAENSNNVIVAILAILKAGGVYLPINVDYPDERKRYIISDCGAEILLTNCGYAFNHVSRVVDLDDSDIYKFDACTNGRRNDPLAYIMYTSGSTGTPKGVMVEQKSVVRLVKNTNYFEFMEGDSILLTGALEFDATTFEIWGALLNGLVLHLVNKAAILNPGKLKQAVRKSHTTTMWMTSPLFNQMLDADIEIFAGLRNLLVGGDVLSIAHINRLRERFSRLNIINGYGPTENTTFSTTYQVNRNFSTSIPIGKPISNTTAYILDRYFHLLPIGVAGELYLGGDGLSRGYLNNPELTAEKYISAERRAQSEEFLARPEAATKPTPPLRGTPPKRGISTGSPLGEIAKELRVFPSREGWFRGTRNRGVLESSQENKIFTHSSIEENSEERYVPDAVRYALCDSPRSGIKLYRTGDLARWLPDGNIEFLGRVDYQVKIRGYRIEPGEIENRLLNHPDVNEALVLARRYETGENYLCAYIVVGNNGQGTGRVETGGSVPDVDICDAGQIREYLSGQLPAYMVPSYYIFIEKMPLNPNGKVDLKALPGPGVGSVAAPYAAPRDEIEEKLCNMWSEVLALASPPGINDNFFDLGGHSLRATTLVYNIYQTLGVNMEIEDVFSHPTVRELALRLKELEASTYAAITPVEAKEYYQMSYAQRRLWVLCQFEADSTAYNMPLAVTLSGPVAAGAFTQAVQRLAERHESFRTLFILVDGSPRQKIIHKKDFKFHLETVDLRSLDEEAREEETRGLFVEFANRVFDLEHGPLFCFKLVRLADEECVLMFNMHHIVNDGWSQGVITNEIITLYNAYRKGEKDPLPPLQLQYNDYTRWHNRLIESEGFVTSREYWLDRFKDKPNGVELPFDHPRQAIQTFNGGRVSFTIDEQRTSKLLEIGKEEDATLFMILLTVVSVFLYRYSGQTDIIIGAPIANRKRPEISHIVGFLVNTLVYRNEICPDWSFKQQVKSVKQTSLEGYRYQDYPFDLLVEQLELERDLSQSPLFNIMLAHNNAKTEDIRLAFEGITLSGYRYSEEFNMSKFDLIFFMDEVGDGVLTRIEYNSDLFERCTIERMAENFLAFVDHVIADNDGPLSSLPIISAREYEAVTHHFNDTRCDFPPLTLQEMFEHQVEKTPDKIALVGPPEGKSLPRMITYRDLNSRVNRFAHFLRNKTDVKANDVIGILMERSIEMIIVLLGIIKSGAAYLAVDPTYPRERVLHVLSNSQSDCLITDRMRPELFADYPGKILDMNVLADESELESSRNPRVLNQPTDVLYVNYTSGSTGTPNGAMLSHDCLTNLIQWQNEKTTIDCSLRVLQFTTISFCVSFQEIMGTLTSGGELNLIGDIERQDINYLMDFLASQRIEILFLPFSYLNFLFNESSRWHRAFTHSLKHIITAGEQLKITAGLKRFLDLNPEIHLHNHYGSTEMHVVTSYTLKASTAARTLIPPAGKPISNVKIFILDEHLNPVLIGVYGELFVAGRLEILGYINNEELSRQKLISLPRLSGIKLYRSGDIGRWLPDGNIELRGRRDFMVKVRGFRVEPGEIESKILAIEKVRECVVVVKEDASGQMHLVAYVSLDGIDASEIRRSLGNELPQYMIPKIVILDSLPLMPNGKVDRERLPETDIKVDEDRFIVPPGNEVERKLVDIWSELLSLESSRISIDDNFFEIGGHSLKATTMMSRIHKDMDARVELVEIFKTPTIREIASLIRAIVWIKEGEAEADAGQQVKEIFV